MTTNANITFNIPTSTTQSRFGTGTVTYASTTVRAMVTPISCTPRLEGDDGAFSSYRCYTPVIPSLSSGCSCVYNGNTYDVTAWITEYNGNHMTVDIQRRV